MSDSEMTPKLTDEESAELFKHLKKHEMPDDFSLFEEMKKSLEQTSSESEKASAESLECNRCERIDCICNV